MTENYGEFVGMGDPNVVSVTDQLTSAMRDIFKEKGCDVKVTIATTNSDDGGMQFDLMMDKTDYDAGIMNSVLTEAWLRIGGTLKEDE